MAKKEVEEKKIEEIVEVSETPVEAEVEEEVKEEVEENLDTKKTNEDIDEEDTTENVEVEQVEEEVPVVEEEVKEEKSNKKSCNCKRQLTTKDVFGYMWMGQIYGE